ncbi:MAG: thioredoxin family protein [Bacteroidota bacterium]
MHNKITLLFMLLLLPFMGDLAAQGVQFREITFEEALERAEEENKLIYIDFYTDWCGPCKSMTHHVFPDAEVGALYNKHFINLKINPEKQGRPTAGKYGVGAYPTSLFVDHNGDIVYRMVGGLSIEGMLEMGKTSLESVQSNYSLPKLQALFPEKQDDEEFLKMYFTKMIANGESPVVGIEAWLKVQTSIRESDVDMMEFLLDHSKYLIVDGKAEEIFDANYDEYWDIATRHEELALKQMRGLMIQNTKKLAYQKEDPLLMHSFIANWKELPEATRNGNLNDFELDALWFEKNTEDYKILATRYLDSIITAKTLDQIRSEDQEAYEAFVAKMGNRQSLIGNYIKENLRQGKEARLQMFAIVKTGRKYLDLAEQRSDYRKLNEWIEYGLNLVPVAYDMENFQASVLYKQGKVKKAIKAKESALSKMPEDHKKRGTVKRELERMRTGLSSSHQ